MDLRATYDLGQWCYSGTMREASYSDDRIGEGATDGRHRKASFWGSLYWL